MKIYCEHCEKEITDEELVSTEHGAFHDEGCFSEYCYMQYATVYKLDEYKSYIQKLEANHTDTDTISEKIDQHLETEVINELKNKKEDTECFQAQIVEEHGNLLCYLETNCGNFYYYSIKETDTGVELIELEGE